MGSKSKKRLERRRQSLSSSSGEDATRRPRAPEPLAPLGQEGHSSATQTRPDLRHRHAHSTGELPEPAGSAFRSGEATPTEDGQGIPTLPADFSPFESPTKASPTLAQTPWTPESYRKLQGPPAQLQRHLSAESVFYQSFLQKELAGRPLHQRKRSWFIIGILLGVAVSVFCLGAHTHNPQYVEKLSNYISLSLADVDLKSLIPSHLSVEDLLTNITSFMDAPGGPVQEVGDFQPALALVEAENLTAHYPVVLMPGTISTGLESWGSSDCSRRYFRQRMWGTLAMFRAVLMDKACWVEHMKLDPDSGLDPPGIKLRAAKGLDAADYFISGYWVWGKVIENLAVLGYDNNNMHLAAYDWRLAYEDLERRDGYFTQLKALFEINLAQSGRRSVVVTHSMGATVFLYFMHWVESAQGANGGSNWVDRHIQHFVSIGGPMLGVTKTLSSLLSGEQRETVQPMVSYILERFFNRAERAELFRSWGGLGSLIPRGGNRIWGNSTWAPDDVPNPKGVEPGAPENLPERPTSFGQVLLFPSGNGNQLSNATMDEALDLLRRSTPAHFHTRIDREYSFGTDRDPESLAASRDRPGTWSNPLESQLPLAPRMKLYCLYGVGKNTERSYYYTDGVARHDEGAASVEAALSPDPEPVPGGYGADEPSVATEEPPAPSVFIDVSVNTPDLETESGIRVSDGDGTVPLLSLGYMCVNGWRDPLYNPAGIDVVTREYRHNPTHMIKDLRGGSDTADHVDILGNYQVISDLLRIAAGREDAVEARIVSDIQQIADNVQLDRA
ncbi:phospholipid:diacylglycerol acyltransferase [Tieghemiomyces parasiticus]|uniref:Phospholipid:diacylglycerol acyltransferase n=1 Tax=Tieghemiomyces parasiticus TaxID=78921 RepID=A0A9W7ZW52_9FUNG|nr:phospholipid:diacylglycerol acyltransferase [Tieghemiomyces parasiticus]